MDRNFQGELDVSSLPNEGFQIQCKQETLFIERVMPFNPQKFKTEKPPVLKKSKYNILVLYVDGLSRKHFIRSFPKVTKLLSDKKFLRQKNIELFQFIKMHSISHITVENTEAFVMGTISNNTKAKRKDISQINYFNMPSIQEDFGKCGWATVKIDDR